MTFSHVCPYHWHIDLEYISEPVSDLCEERSLERSSLPAVGHDLIDVIWTVIGLFHSLTVHQELEEILGREAWVRGSTHRENLPQ